MAPPPNGMHELVEQLETLEQSANLSASIDDVQKTIDLLTAARAKVANGESSCRVLRSTTANLACQTLRPHH
jgi:hypothetical protein